MNTKENASGSTGISMRTAAMVAGVGLFLTTTPRNALRSRTTWMRRIRFLSTK